MKIFKKFSVMVAIILLSAACHANKNTHLPQNQKTREITAEWDKGNAIADEGSRLIKSGEMLINQGETNIKEGNKKIAKGAKIMRNCDFAFQEYAEEADYHELDDC